MKLSRILFFTFVASTQLFGNLVVAEESVKKDAAGREIIEGPVTGSFYSNVRIVSDSVGVKAYGPATIINSVIEAPVCVQAGGQGLTLRGNELDCQLCVEFTGSMLMNNQLSSNRCSGQGTNRPDAFGW